MSNKWIIIPLAMTSILTMLFIQMKEMKKNKKSIKNPFECGMENMTNKKTSYSTNFMVMTMVFLIFDMEISILIPPIMMKKTQLSMNMTMCVLFLSILTILTIKEWKQGSLDWSK